MSTLGGTVLLQRDPRAYNGLKSDNHFCRVFALAASAVKSCNMVIALRAARIYYTEGNDGGATELPSGTIRAQ